MSVDSIDYKALALSRITQQYRDKEKFVALVQGLANLVDVYIETPAAEVFNVLDIDSMRGDNLDVIGRLVGQPRELIDYSTIDYFELVTIADVGPGVGSLGTLSDPAIGSRLRSVDEPELGGVQVLSDPEYRIFIKARILRNYSNSTPEEIRDSVKLITGADQVIIENGAMEMSIGVLGNIDATTLDIIDNYDILPRPTGVNIDSVYSFKLLGFNGSSSVIDYSDVLYHIGTNAFQVNVSIIANEYAAGAYKSIYSHSISWFMDGFEIALYNNRISLVDGAIGTTVTSDETIELGVKYRIRLEKTGTTANLYINDVLSITRAATADYGSDPSIKIGSDSSTFFNGIISEVKFTNASTVVIDSILHEGTGTVATNDGTGSNGTITDPLWVTGIGEL